jgi:hypothetical protein
MYPSSPFEPSNWVIFMFHCNKFSPVRNKFLVHAESTPKTASDGTPLPNLGTRQKCITRLPECFFFLILLFVYFMYIYFIVYMPLLDIWSSENKPGYSFEGHSNISRSEKYIYTPKYFIYLNTLLLSQ